MKKEENSYSAQDRIESSRFCLYKLANNDFFMRSLSLILIYFGLSLSALAQDANGLLIQGQDAYDNGDYAKSISMIHSCENALGYPTPRTQSLLALSYANLEDWKNAAIAIRSYFILTPPAANNSEAHKDMKVLLSKIELELSKLDSDYKANENKRRDEAAKRVVESFQDSENRKIKKLQEDSEKKLYTIYSQSKDPDELSDYKKMFPESKFNKEIEFKKLVLLGDGDFDKNKWSSAISLYQNALDIRSDAKVNEKLETARDEQAFQKAKESGKREEYEKYLKNFKIHRLAADDFIFKSYLKEAKNYQKKTETNYLYNTMKTISDRYRGTSLWQDNKSEYYNILTKEIDLYKLQPKKFRVYHSSKVLNYYSQLYKENPTKYQSEYRHFKRRNKAWNRPDYNWYLAYRGDKSKPFGFDMGIAGGLTNLGPGFFLSGRGHLFGPGEEPEDRKGLDYLQYFSSINIAKKVFYPIWIYGGLGYAHYTKIEIDPTDPTLGFIPAEGIKKAGGLNIETGIIINIGSIIGISVGASFPQFSSSAKEELGLEKFHYVPNFAVGMMADLY